MYFVNVLLEDNVFLVDDVHPFSRGTVHIVVVGVELVHFVLFVSDSMMSLQRGTFVMTLQFLLE